MSSSTPHAAAASPFAEIRPPPDTEPYDASVHERPVVAPTLRPAALESIAARVEQLEARVQGLEGAPSGIAGQPREIDALGFGPVEERSVEHYLRGTIEGLEAKLREVEKERDAALRILAERAPLATSHHSCAQCQAFAAGRCRTRGRRVEHHEICVLFSERAP